MQKLIKHLSLTGYKNQELPTICILCCLCWQKCDPPKPHSLQSIYIFVTENVSAPATTAYDIFCQIGLSRNRKRVELAYPVQV